MKTQNSTNNLTKYWSTEDIEATKAVAKQFNIGDYVSLISIGNPGPSTYTGTNIPKKYVVTNKGESDSYLILKQFKYSPVGKISGSEIVPNASGVRIDLHQDEVDKIVLDYGGDRTIDRLKKARTIDAAIKKIIKKHGIRINDIISSQQKMFWLFSTQRYYGSNPFGVFKGGQIYYLEPELNSLGTEIGDGWGLIDGVVYNFDDTHRAIIDISEIQTLIKERYSV